MKKIDLSVLKSIEKKHSNSKVCLRSLETMVDLVLKSQANYNTIGLKYEMNYEIAVNTLVELGVLVEETRPNEATKVELLKS